MPDEIPNAVQLMNAPAGGGGPDAGGAPTPTPTPTFDADAFATKFGDKIGEHLKSIVPAHREPEQPPMTPEQARKALNVMEFGDDFMQKFGNLETQKSAFEQLRDGMFLQSRTYMHALMEHKLKEAIEAIHNEYRPIAERFTASEGRAQTERFNTAYPALADEALQPIIQAVGQHLVANKLAEGKTEAEAFKMLADGVAAVMKKHNPNFSLSGSASAAAGAKPKPNGNPNAQPAQSRGGGGGGGTGGADASSPTGNRALDILSGKVKA